LKLLPPDLVQPDHIAPTVKWGLFYAFIQSAIIFSLFML
jgi:hypothetical protein